VSIGGPRLLESLGLALPSPWRASSAQPAPKGSRWCTWWWRGNLQPALPWRMLIRPESREAVQRLARDWACRSPCSPRDSQAVAKAVAEELGVDTFFAEVLPEHKNRRSPSCSGQGKRVRWWAMASTMRRPLTRADIGIAIASGTDVAVESAGIIRGAQQPAGRGQDHPAQPGQLPQDAAKPAWATGYNVVALPLALACWRPGGSCFPGCGSGADVGQHHHRRHQRSAAVGGQ